VVVVFLSVTLSAFAQDRAAAPTYSEGEYWEYKVTREGLPALSDQLDSGVYRVEFKKGEIEADEVFWGARASIYNSLSEQKWFNFPLHVGKKWSFRYFWERARGGGTWQYPELVVDGLETVTTPAGTFKAFKITREEGQRSYIYWYSPGTKSVVNFYYKREHLGTGEITKITWELTAYKVHKK